MAAGKRTDIKTRASIVIDKINNPDLSVRDLSEEYGIWKSTVSDIINEVTDTLRTSSDNVLEIVNDALEATAIMGKVTLTMAKDIQARQLQAEDWADKFKPSTDEIRTLNTTVDTWFKRAQLLSWKATERIDIWDFSNKTQKELELIRQQELL